MDRQLTVKEGIRDGFPIFWGYFATSIAFGLLARESTFTLFEALLTSLTNFAGSGQFLFVNLWKTGTALFELLLSVFLINSRYIFMSLSIYPKLEDRENVWKKIVTGFGLTDEVYAVASFKEGKLPFRYMFSLSATSYSGWFTGTLLGFVIGSFLPGMLQKASAITLYAMFASIIGNEVRKDGKKILVVLMAAFLNTLFIAVLKISTGFSFFLTIVLSTFIAALMFTDEEAGV